MRKGLSQAGAVLIAILIIAAAGVGVYYTSTLGGKQTVTQTVTQPASTITQSAAQPRVFRIAVLTSGGPDNSWINTVRDGVTHTVNYYKQQGLTVTVDYVYSVAYGDVQSVLTTYASKGYDLIIPADAPYNQATLIVAKQYPNVQFLGTSFSNMSSNVGDASWDVWAGYYPAGVAAGLVTKTNTIGFVVAFSFTQSNWAINAFLAGAKLVNPNVKIVYAFTQDWHDPVKGGQAAASLIAAGADVVAGMGDGMTDGVVKQAEKSGAYAVGYFYDENSIAPKTVITSAMWNFTTYGIQAVKLSMDHQLGNHRIQFTLTQGGSFITPFHGLLTSDQAAKANDLIAKMASGALVPPENEKLPQSGA